MREIMRRFRRTLFVLAFATLLLAPAQVHAQDPVLVVGQHTITLQKSGLSDPLSVREAIHYRVDDQTFDGILNFSLDPRADLAGWFLTRDGVPFPGEAGQVQGDLPAEETDGFLVFRLDLSTFDVTFEEGRTYGVQLMYALPSDARSFQRQIDQPTPQVALFVDSLPGLEPQGDDPRMDLRSIGNTWRYNTVPPEDPEPWVPGETIDIALVDVDDPKTPLTLSVRTIGTDPLQLRAEADGGIPGEGYTYSWDLDGDGECETEEESVTLDRSRAGTHEVTACVVDARGAEVRTTYETLVVEGPVVQIGPTAWLLALLGVVVGGLLVYGMVSGGLIRSGGGAARSGAQPSRSFAAESKDMLALRQRVMVAGLKELEIAKKKGEVAEGLYTPLKAELKQDTVRVMRELERRREETV